MAIKLNDTVSPPGQFNVKSYGAIGNGTVDDTSAIQAAITACTSGTVFFPVGTYKVTTPLALHSGVHLRGSGQDESILDFSTYTTATAVITGAGSVGSAILLSVNATACDRKITLASVAGLAVGDRLLLGSDEGFKHLTAGGNYSKGENCIIEDISGFVVTLASPLYDDYATASNARVYKVTSLSDAGVHDLTIKRLTQETVGVQGIQISYADRFSVVNVRMQYCTEAAIRFFHGLRCLVKDSYIDHTWYAATGTSYCVSIANACEDCLIVNNFFYKFRHAVSIGKNGDVGVPRKIIIEGNTADQTSDVQTASSFDAHEPAQYISYLNNTIRSSIDLTTLYFTPGIGVECWDVVISGNTIYGGGGIGVGYGTAVMHTAPDAYSNTIVTNNVIVLSGPATFGIRINTSGCIVSNNIIRQLGPVGSCIGSIMLDGGRNVNVPVQDIVVTGNIISNVYTGVYVLGCTRVRVSGNSIKDFRIAGIMVREGADTTTGNHSIDISDNFITDSTSTGQMGIWSYPGTAVNTDIFFDHNKISLTCPGNIDVLIPAAECGYRDTSSVALWSSNGVSQLIKSGTAAPTTGTWAVGTIFYNTAPVAGGSIGWVCTSLGSGPPGTWKTFGTISP